MRVRVFVRVPVPVCEQHVARGGSATESRERSSGRRRSINSAFFLLSSSNVLIFGPDPALIDSLIPTPPHRIFWLLLLQQKKPLKDDLGPGPRHGSDPAPSQDPEGPGTVDLSRSSWLIIDIYLLLFYCSSRKRHDDVGAEVRVAAAPGASVPRAVQHEAAGRTDVPAGHPQVLRPEQIHLHREPGTTAAADLSQETTDHHRE